MLLRKLYNRIVCHTKNLLRGFQPLTEVSSFDEVPEFQKIQKDNNRFLLAYIEVTIVTWISIVIFSYQHRYYQSVLLPEESADFLRLVTRLWPNTGPARNEQRDVIGFGCYAVMPGYYLPMMFEK